MQSGYQEPLHLIKELSAVNPCHAIFSQINQVCENQAGELYVVLYCSVSVFVTFMEAGPYILKNVQISDLLSKCGLTSCVRNRKQ